MWQNNKTNRDLNTTHLWTWQLLATFTVWAEHHVILVRNTGQTYVTVKTCIFLPNPMHGFKETLNSSRTQNLRPECDCLLWNDSEPHSPSTLWDTLQYIPNLHGCELHVYMSVFCYLNSSGTSTSSVNSTGYAHFIPSASLALEPCKFSLGFPHDWCPFYSV